MSNAAGATASLEKTWYHGPRLDVAGHVPSSARRILDVGCAAGELGLVLKQRADDVEVTGVEMSPRLAKAANDRLDRVLIGTIEDVLPELPDGFFDCVIFADVLEHLVNPYQLLADIRRTINLDNGMVLASVPNVRHFRVLKMLLFEGQWEYCERGIMDSGHLRFFTRASMLAMFRWAGYIPDILSVNSSASRQVGWLTGRVGGRRIPFLDYQYIVGARPIPGFDPPSEPWYSRQRAL